MTTVDTNILIDALRGMPEAVRYLSETNRQFAVSAVSITELYAGLRGSNELNDLQTFLKSFTIHIVDESIAILAGQYMNRFAKSHDLGIADALIGATATNFNEELATLNTKHFPMLTAIRPY